MKTPRSSKTVRMIVPAIFGVTLAANASTDYGPAIWRPCCNANYNTSGYGHKFHVCHDMEGYYWTSINMMNACSYTAASIHYFTNGKKDNTSDAAPGEITQSVRDAYYAWHARCWNQYSTGTEHEGFASNPAWYTPEQYSASAGITRNLSNKFGFAKDRYHIVGHGEKSNAAWCSYAEANFGIDAHCNSHTDPGPYWDWNGYINMVINGGCNIAMTGGAIRAKYEALGGCGSFLGAPTTYELTCPDGVGKYNHFANGGSIYWTPSTGAFEVHGNIRTKWSNMGWEKSYLGYPVTDESAAANGGRFNHFQNGSIYWHSATGAWSIGGAIRSKWAALGWENSFLGFPTTDESACAVGGGRYNHFQGGSIYWSSATGAWSVGGAIRDKWASMGWETSCLGYPTSDEYAFGSQRRSDFQNGCIVWDSVNGAVAYCGTPPPAKVDVTVDNAAAGFTVTGAWSTGTGSTDKFGADYRYHSTAAVSEPAQWQASLANTGSYVVSAWWPQGSNRAAAAPYVVYHSTGNTTVNANQQANGGKWNSLGTFTLNAGTNQVRLSCWTATGFMVMADAIRWQQQ